MQTVKEKLSDMKEMRKVKAEARAEEQAERELAKARADIAHEVRLAKEAEGAMDLHVAKAGKKAEREIAKHTANHNQPPHSVAHQNDGPGTHDHLFGQDYQKDPVGSSTTTAATTTAAPGLDYPNNPARSSTATTAANTGPGLKNTSNTAGAPPKNSLLPPDFNIFTSNPSK